MTNYALNLQVHVPLDFSIGLPSITSNPAEHSVLTWQALISHFHLTLQEFLAWFSFSVDRSKAQKTIPLKRKDTMKVEFWCIFVQNKSLYNESRVLVYFCAK
jgi:hypothetical protein